MKNTEQLNYTIWDDGGRGFRILSKDGDSGTFIVAYAADESVAARIVACVNAGAGMEDPAAELARLRAIEEAAKGCISDDECPCPGRCTCPPPGDAIRALRAALEGKV